MEANSDGMFLSSVLDHLGILKIRDKRFKKSVSLSNEVAPGKTTCVNLQDPGGTKDWFDCQAIDENKEHEIQSKTLQPEVSNQENVERHSFGPEKTTSHSGLTVLMLAPLLALASSQNNQPNVQPTDKLHLQEKTLLPFPYEETKAAEKVLREYWDPSDGKGEILDEASNLEEDILVNDIEYIYSDMDDVSLDGATETNGKHSNLIEKYPKQLSSQLTSSSSRGVRLGEGWVCPPDLSQLHSSPPSSNLYAGQTMVAAEDLFEQIIQADGNQKNLIEKFHTEFSFEDMVYVSWSADHSLLQSNDSLKNENLLWNSMDVFQKSERKEEKKGIGKNASHSCDDSVCSSVKSNDLLGKKDLQWNAYETLGSKRDNNNKEEKAAKEIMILIDDKYKFAILL